MEEERENSTAALAPSAGTIVLPGTAVAANWPPTRNSNNNNSTLPTLASSSAATAAATAAATEASSSSHFRGGFSSSICGGLFRHHDVTHSDCCALACCGIFLEDRNRFLLAASGVPPPPLWKRVVQYVGMPVVLALVVGVILTKTLGLDQLEENSNNNSSSSNGNKNNSNSESSDQTQQEQIDKALIRFLVLTVLILLLQVYYCLAVPRRRAERQKIIDRIQAVQNQQQQQQQQHGTTPGSSQTFPYQQGSSPPSMYEMKRELQSSHPMCCCCGFYPQDRLSYQQQQQQEQYQQQQPPVSNDLCYCLWQALSKLCCGFCCMCWCQCCGSCALAQEDRELQRILPPEEFQRDYITMESHAEYYPRILRVRELRQGSVWAHYQALSQLSKQLLVWLVGIWIFLALTSFLPFHALGPGQVLLGLAVLGQALILLLLVHWIWHRFDLSLDAVIKYFASGFCLCTGMTLLYEIGVSMSTGIILSIIKLVFMLDGFLKVMQDSSNSDTNSNNDDANQSSNAARKWAEYVKEFDRHHMGLVVLGAFVNAFFVAAAVEEMTKYFSFWMVDHPDLQTGNDNLAAPTTTTTTVALDSSHANGTATDETAIVISSPQILVSSSANTNGFAGTTNTTLPPSLARNRRSNASRGAAITVAMVTTALGFACAENFLYVFVYSPANVAIQVFTLILRAMFPVHPVCAALQSIGVCQRDILSKYTTLASSSSSSSSTYSYANTGSGVDATKRLGLGRILLPAWLLHGTFDFSLMVLAAWVAANHPTSSNNDDATNSNNNNGGNDDNANSNNNNDTGTVDESAGVADLISLILSVVIFASGLVYYFWASWRQRRALKALDDMLDQTDTIENSNNNNNNQEPSSSDAMVLASQPVQATLVTNLAYVPTSHDTNNNNTRSDPSTSADWIV